MRSLNEPLREVFAELSAFAGPTVRRPALEALCQVELGLHLQRRLMPDSPAAHAWVLFSGYPFATTWGAPMPADAETMLHVGRYSLWTLRRGRAWREALERYQRFARPLRVFDVPDPALPAEACETSVAHGRGRVYDELLRLAPPLTGKRLGSAGPGPHAFPVGRNMAVVDLPSVPGTPLVAHDVDMLPPGGGEPLTFSLAELERTAARMDARQCGQDWVGRLRAFNLSTRQGNGFGPSTTFTVSRIQHLLGIVGAGKSTLRDIIAVHLATLPVPKRVTVVVGDVTEVLKLVKLYNAHTRGAAAPILGAAGRERHAQRLHRRLAGRGEHRLLAHDDSSFDYLGTSCALNVLRRGTPGEGPLGFGEAPCNRLQPKSRRPEPTDGQGAVRWQKQTVSCPYWSACPRHHAARELVDADIWVTTQAGLIDARPPRPQNRERIRYLELACRRSDLVIVDEADRVQMQWDQAFAPAVLLAGGDKDGFIDKLSGHKTREFSVGGRTQLSDRDVENFSAALNTAAAATDRLYAMLVGSHELRTWVRTGYFSAWTLQLGLLDERYPLLDDDDRSGQAGPDTVVREALGTRLDAFRDNPFGDRFRLTKEDFAELTGLLNEVLHTSNPEHTRRRLVTVMEEVFRLDEPFMAARTARYEEELAIWKGKLKKWEDGPRTRKKPRPPQSPENWKSEFARKFEFTLLLCALEPKLALINTMWPRVEAALRLGYNSMYRRPADYGPMVPEAPMGNVLGFQFHVKGPDEGGVRSGELSFFRCSGVGRELLRAMPDLAAVDGRPGAHVLLMSGSSWAGRSSRYHIPVDVGVVIEPRPEVTRRIAEESEMRIEFISEDGAALRISGTAPEDRPEMLRRIVTRLGASVDEDKEDGGPLEVELLSLPAGRDQILLLVGSYEEARVAADALHTLNSRWKNKVLRLVSDDEDIEDGSEGDSDHHAQVLRRGDVEHLKDCGADILVAPLLAVERGHNILNDESVAAIGTVYFLARPNPHPDDLALAVHAINDWIVRAMGDGTFATWVRSGATVEEGADEVRRQARSRWYQVLQRSMAWSRLGDDREQVTWDMLVLMWQVIGRLVRGGVPARVVFVDAAFAPYGSTTPPRPDTPESSLLHSVLDVLRPYFTDTGGKSGHDRFITEALYGPLWLMLNRCLNPAPRTDEPEEPGRMADESGGTPCTT
ncbi:MULTISPECIES: pPIWI_RE_Z domain-containing protein [unclassified Streptomyces]|uniref:pPIWI_RE_Z domain-containing protein n=1 Tax=Streptomyces sp. NPDC127532 TaxID=3345399 RepID=UPI003636B3BB